MKERRKGSRVWIVWMILLAFFFLMTTPASAGAGNAGFENGMLLGEMSKNPEAGFSRMDDGTERIGEQLNRTVKLLVAEAEVQLTQQVKRKSVYVKKKAGNPVLVNKENPRPVTYRVSLAELDCGERVSNELETALKRMLSAAEKEDLYIVVASGYRTKKKQIQLMEEEIQKNLWDDMSPEEAKEDALLTVAPPGFSEHETGLAVDLVAAGNQNLDETQEKTDENKWLRNYCAEFGFILRYPRGKEKVTGFSYESWHFRYVGIKAAKEITARKIALEEYLEK